MINVYLFALVLGVSWTVAGFRRNEPDASLPRVVAPLAAFGGTGLLLHTFGAGPWPVHLLLALTAGGSATLLRRGRNPKAERAARPLPARARVVIGIPAGGVGEIAWEGPERRWTALARSADGAAVPGGTVVRVLADEGVGLLVAPLEPAAASGRAVAG